MTDPSEHSGSRWEPTERAPTAGQATTSSGGGAKTVVNPGGGGFPSYPNQGQGAPHPTPVPVR